MIKIWGITIRLDLFRAQVSKNDGFCNKTEESCIKNEEFCMKMMNSAQIY